MASTWQLWLSPRPQQRTPNNSKSSFYHLGNAALYEPLTRADGSWYARETHYIDHPLTRAGLTGPPLHIHRLQDEYFKVEQGSLGVVKNGVEHVVTKDDGVFHIPAGTRHRFWAHQTGTETLVFTFWVNPSTQNDYLLDINFLRNLSGYLDDCVKAGLQPSMLQVILMTQHVSSVLCPPFLNWMPTWLLIPVHRLLAWYAQRVLGYEMSYPEYTREL